jgi:hypothetical protein
MCANDEISGKDVFRGGTFATSSATAWITKSMSHKKAQKAQKVSSTFVLSVPLCG